MHRLEIFGEFFFANEKGEFKKTHVLIFNLNSSGIQEYRQSMSSNKVHIRLSDTSGKEFYIRRSDISLAVLTGLENNEKTNEDILKEGKGENTTENS